MGRKRIYTDEQRAERKRERRREWKRRKSIEKFGTKEEREAKELERRNTVVERCDSFEYVGNYTGSDGTADIRCTKCGTITTRSWSAIRHGKVQCEACRRIETERKKAKEQQRKKDEKDAMFFHADRKQAEIRICPECGKAFLPRTDRQRCCGTECGTKTNNRIKWYRRRRKIDVATMDRTITLRAVYEKDAGICYLCGQPCEWNDFLEREDAFVAGDLYPSIDHVQPLSKGGRHAWENVRLAHRRCNSLKSDSPLS